MTDEQDYYKVLGIDPDADEEAVRRAYRAQAMAYHPDRMFGVSEEEKRLAGEKLKAINLANEVLSDLGKRRRYHQEWLESSGSPRPVVDLTRLRFYDVAPGELQTASFVVRNDGGPYSSIRIGNPDSWVSIAGYESLTDDDELPLRVRVEAVGDQWGKSYRESIAVGLDEQEIQVVVELRTRPLAYRRASATAGRGRPRASYGARTVGRARPSTRQDYGPQENPLALSAVNGATQGMKWVGLAGIVVSVAIGVASVGLSFSLSTSLFMAPLLAILFGIIGAVAGAIGGAVVGLVYGALTRS